eukprot:2367254-Amphidinium_carterae.1
MVLSVKGIQVRTGTRVISSRHRFHGSAWFHVVPQDAMKQDIKKHMSRREVDCKTKFKPFNVLAQVAALSEILALIFMGWILGSSLIPHQSGYEAPCC